MRQRTKLQLVNLAFVLLFNVDVANSVGDDIANFAQKLGGQDETLLQPGKSPQKSNLSGPKKQGSFPVTAFPVLESDVNRRSAEASASPIDLLMDHQVDFIEDQIDWKWCLLALSGNATIVKLRRNEFVKYLKMNVAAQTGSEYDFVRVTSISYTPYVLVNVSLDWNEATEPRIVKSLGRLASRNDTLLELSGQHFNLTDFLPASALLSPKALSPLEERDAASATADPRQVEAMIYLVIGATLAFLLTATTVFTVCHCINRRMPPQPDTSNQAAASKLNSEAGDEFDHLQPHQQRSSSRQTFNRHSYLQQSPLTEETISLDDFDRRSLRSLQPKLIYTQEFSEGLMVLPHDENSGNGIDMLDGKDDSLAPLASFDGEEVGAGYIPHQFLLRRPQHGQPQQPQHHHQHHSHPHRHRRHHLQLHTEGSIGRRRGMNGHQNHYNHNGSQRPHSEMIHSPMSEIHPVGPTSISRNGMPPRPNSVLEDPSYFPPLSPPPDFHSGYMSDVPTSSLNNGGHSRRPRRSSRPSETALILSSFKPIPSISQPTPEEIQRDVDVVFHNLGLDSQSPIRDFNNGIQDAPFPVQDAPFSAQDAPYSAQDAFTYDFDDASMTHSITAEEGMLLGAPPPPQD